MSESPPLEQPISGNGNGHWDGKPADLEQHPIGQQTETAAQTTTWAPLELGPILAGDLSAPEPTMLARTDGRCLLYPQRIHTLQAEPEALKSWIALHACRRCLDALQAVVYIDFEDGPASVIGRLLTMGVEPQAIEGGFVYIRPDEALAADALQDLDNALQATEPELAVIDGVTEAFAQNGLSALDNGDVATYLELLPRRLVRGGAAVLQLDHVVKDRESRGRYAIGAQHKLAGVDVAYSLRVIEPFGRGRDGLVAVKVEKDRPGGVREFATAGQAALVRAISDPEDGTVRIVVEPPEQRGDTFRPTVLMERAWETIDATPGLSMRGVREATTGKGEYIDTAVRMLVQEGYVERREDGSAHRYYPLKPFSQAEGVPVSQPCPSVSGRRVAETVSPCPTPPRGDTDTTRHTGRSGTLDPDPDAELARIAAKGLAQP